VDQSPQRGSELVGGAVVEIVLRDVEARGDMPASVLNLARMNYDLYAASLALLGRDNRTFGGYAWSALRRAPLEATALLATNGLWRITSWLRQSNKPLSFHDLGPDDRLPMPLSDWFSDFQARSANRAVRNWSLPPDVAEKA